MKVLDEHTKFAHLGKPGSVFSMGFARRLDLIESYVDLNNNGVVEGNECYSEDEFVRK